PVVKRRRTERPRPRAIEILESGRKPERHAQDFAMGKAQPSIPCAEGPVLYRWPARVDAFSRKPGLRPPRACLGCVGVMVAPRRRSAGPARASSETEPPFL